MSNSKSSFSKQPAREPVIDRVLEIFVEQIKRFGDIIENQQGKALGDKVRVSIPATAEKAQQMLGMLTPLSIIEATETLGRLNDSADAPDTRAVFKMIAEVKSPVGMLGNVLSMAVGQGKFYEQVVVGRLGDPPLSERARAYWSKPENARRFTVDISFDEIFAASPDTRGFRGRC